MEPRAMADPSNQLPETVISGFPADISKITAIGGSPNISNPSTICDKLSLGGFSGKAEEFQLDRADIGGISVETLADGTLADLGAVELADDLEGSGIQERAGICHDGNLNEMARQERGEGAGANVSFILEDSGTGTSVLWTVGRVQRTVLCSLSVHCTVHVIDLLI